MTDYSEKLMDHFANPRNVGMLDDSLQNVGTSVLESKGCGDCVRLQIQVKNNIITAVKFKAYGCSAAIASSSVATTMLVGKTLDQALMIKDADIADYLELSESKRHCSVLAEKSIKTVINNYKKKQ